MLRPDRVLAAIAALLLAVGSCAPAPSPSGSPSARPGPSSPSIVAPSEPAFKAGAWPKSGSACDRNGYAGLIGRIQATDARTVRFTLCRSDGAFPVRLADPSLAILASSWIDRIATDPSAARSLVGSGPYRIERWEPGQDVILADVPGGAAPAGVPTLVLRWAADAATRLTELSAAAVDAMDAPGTAEIAKIDTLPELGLVPRAGLAIAYLAFGADTAFSDARVRRAIASGFDRGAVVNAAFPPGSSVATHVVPCALPGACDGASWYETNGPAAAADLTTLKFDVATPIALHVPDAPRPGLPDPAAAAAAVAAQLLAGIGLTVTVDVMSATAFDAAVADGSIGGLYLAGETAAVADAGAYLDDLLGGGTGSLPAKRVSGARDTLASIAGSPDAAARAKAVRDASDAVRDAAPLVPIAEVGGYVAIRADVTGLAASALGLDPLGIATPGDRPQLVFMGTSEPASAYCGDARSLDALRLCGLVSGGLYGFAPGTLEAEPRLAERCASNGDATVWTCTLRAGITYTDGTRIDAGDVLASLVAQWDPTQPMRRTRGDAAFATWDRLFGGPLVGGG